MRTDPVEYTFPPGEYYFGDPCYALDSYIYNDIWIDRYEGASGVYNLDELKFTSSESEEDPSGDVSEFAAPTGTRIFAVTNTTYGDGVYEGIHRKYPVDSGTLGIVSKLLLAPQKSIEELSESGFLFSVDKPFTFKAENGRFKCTGSFYENVDTRGDYNENTKRKLMNNLTEGRKSNVLKMLSQLHTYLARYDDLDKAEERFKQRFEDAGCSDLYAVIDDVLDVVDIAKKAEKAKLLNKIYKQYFPKAAKEDPASDEDVEKAIDDHHLDGAGTTEEAIEDEADEKTLGDIRKTDPEELTTVEGTVKEEETEGTPEQDENKNEDEDLDENDDASNEDEDLEEGIRKVKGGYQNIGKSGKKHSKTPMTKKQAHAQQQAMYASGFKENFGEFLAEMVRTGNEDLIIENSIRTSKMNIRKLKEGFEDEENFDPEEDGDLLAYISDDDNDDDEFEVEENFDVEDDINDALEDEEVEDETEEGEGTEEEMLQYPEPARARIGSHVPPLGSNESLTDAVMAFIDDQIVAGVDDDEDLIDKIIEEFSDPESSMERHIASEILEEYYEMNDSANEEATEGDIEREYEDLYSEGFPDSEILEKLTTKYGLSKHEVEMIVSNVREEEDEKKNFEEGYRNEVALTSGKRPFSIPLPISTINDVGKYILKAQEAHFSPETIKTVLKATYGLSEDQVKTVFEYLPYLRKKLGTGILSVKHEGTMAGPSDQGGSSVPPPHAGPSASSATVTAPTNTEDTPTAEQQLTGEPKEDPKAILQKNPELANLFKAMAEIEPDELKDVNALLGIKESTGE